MSKTKMNSTPFIWVLDKVGFCVPYNNTIAKIVTSSNPPSVINAGNVRIVASINCDTMYMITLMLAFLYILR